MVITAGALFLFVSLMPFLLQRPLRAWRYTCIEREFMAAWSRLDPRAKQRTVARAWDLGLMPNLTGASLDRLMIRALTEYWRVMREEGCVDFIQMREDFARLLGSAAGSLVSPISSQDGLDGFNKQFEVEG